MKQFFRYWGKTDDAGGYHLLPYHCLDVAAVSAVWWDSSPVIRHCFCAGNDEKRFRAWILFFCALHDYGKFALYFQFKCKLVFKKLYGCDGGTFPTEKEIKDYWHGEAGLYWFRKDFVSLEDTNDSFFADEEEPEQWAAWKLWIEAVTGHHGHLKKSEYVKDYGFSSLLDKRYKEIDYSARIEWLYALEDLFLNPVGLSLTDEPPFLSSSSADFLAGFCSVADWLGSRCDEYNFSFLGTEQDLGIYFEKKVFADAQRVLQQSGILGYPKPFAGVKALLPEGKIPRSLQCVAETLPVEPALTIIEAPTGTGKTEAALTHAWKLVDAGLADAVIFALPTQATANAMFDRLEKAATILFDDSPNLILAHGFARFNEKFTELMNPVVSENDDEQDGWVKCCEWLAESRKRVFLGQIGISTIDQVLISVLPVRHRFVRSFGVGRSVLIVDEVHAYDAYMYGLLEEVLRQQKGTCGSAILLSATLPSTQKQQLFSAWGSDQVDELVLSGYPLISFATSEKTTTFLPPKSEKQEIVTVNVECFRMQDMVPDDELIARIIMVAKEGAQVVVICNLVDAAQTLYDAFLIKVAGLPLELDLFHARFCFLDRQKKERGVLRNFGLEGDRKIGRILVATQVVEQSLDIDFDWIVTQLCPIDLLFQRMGRLHRHAINDAIRPVGFIDRRCTILLPQGEDYGGTGVIYANQRVLWRTEQLLTDCKQIVFPDAYRDCIEKVYQENPWNDEPEQITEAYYEFKDKIEDIKGFAAKQVVNMAKNTNPFMDNDQSITAVTRDGEMSLTVLPYIDSPMGRQTLDGDSLELKDGHLLQEMLMLNSVSVPRTWRGSLEGVQVEKDGRYWLAMQPDGEFFISVDGNAVFRYHHDTGLRRMKK